MSWSADSCHGYGAAELRLSAIPYAGVPADFDLRNLDAGSAGRGLLGQLVGHTPTLVFGAMCVLAVVLVLARRQFDVSDSRIVLIASAPAERPETKPPPNPLVKTVEPQPEPITEPEPVPEPEPIPERPKRVEPRPQLPPRPEPLKPPPPPETIVRPTRPAPVPQKLRTVRPVLAAAVRQIRPTTPLARAPRLAPPRPTRPVTPIARPHPAIEAVQKIQRTAVQTTRNAPPPPTTVRLAARPALGLPIAGPSATDGQLPRHRAGTPPRSSTPRIATRSRSAAPALSLPAAIAPGAPPASAATPRDSNPSAPATPGRDSSLSPEIEGVPLDSLAACPSEREEQVLKQALIAAVRRPICTSPAGRYSFLQTRNLNAFLMRVERSSNRVAADRCVELSRAIECVQKQAAQEARNR